MQATTTSDARDQREQRHAAGDQVDAGRHHRRRVDQGADRRRAFHRVGQPDVQRELRRLADRPAEEQQTDGRQQGPVSSRARLPKTVS